MAAITKKALRHRKLASAALILAVSFLVDACFVGTLKPQPAGIAG